MTNEDGPKDFYLLVQLNQQDFFSPVLLFKIKNKKNKPFSFYIKEAIDKTTRLVRLLGRKIKTELMVLRIPGLEWK